MYGHPRNDIFFHNRWIAARNAVETYISKKNKKILLYVPTFRDDAMEWEHQIDYNRLKQSLEQRFSDEWIILVRMHPRMKAYAKKLIPQEPYCVCLLYTSTLWEHDGGETLWRSTLPINPEVLEYGSKKAEIVDFAFVDNTGRYSNVIEKGSEMTVKMKVLFLSLIHI